MLNAAEGTQRLWLWPLPLLTSLASLIALSRAGSTLFWRSQRGNISGSPLSHYQWFGVIWLLSAAPLLVALAGPVSSYTQATADQLANPQVLIRTLLPNTVEMPHDRSALLATNACFIHLTAIGLAVIGA